MAKNWFVGSPVQCICKTTKTIDIIMIEKHVPRVPGHLLWAAEQQYSSAASSLTLVYKGFCVTINLLIQLCSFHSTVCDIQSVPRIALLYLLKATFSTDTRCGPLPWMFLNIIQHCYLGHTEIFSVEKFFYLYWYAIEFSKRFCRNPLSSWIT